MVAHNGSSTRDIVSDFLQPQSMMTPGALGALAMLGTNSFCSKFPEVRGAWVVLFLSFLFGFAAVIKDAPFVQRALFYVLNSIIIFSVAAGVNTVGQNAQHAYLSVLSPALAADGKSPLHPQMAQADGFFKDWFGGPKDCATVIDELSIDVDGDLPLQPVARTQRCTIRSSNGFPVPDPACTPGAINPTLTLDVLRSPEFRMVCIRNQATTPSEKWKVYDDYRIERPQHNSGENLACELDHLVSFELGGADTLDNIWPQCGPPDVARSERYFAKKDIVENYLAAEVKAGRMDLNDAQRGIATDWTQYLGAALDSRRVRPR